MTNISLFVKISVCFFFFLHILFTKKESATYRKCKTNYGSSIYKKIAFPAKKQHCLFTHQNAKTKHIQNITDN